MLPVSLDINAEVKGDSLYQDINKYYQVFIISGVVLWKYQPTLQYYGVVSVDTEVKCQLIQIQIFQNHFR